MTIDQFKKAQEILYQITEIDHEIERAKNMGNPFGFSHVLQDQIDNFSKICLSELEKKKKTLEEEFAST